jgi:hypothetical protein
MAIIYLGPGSNCYSMRWKEEEKRLRYCLLGLSTLFHHAFTVIMEMYYDASLVKGYGTWFDRFFYPDNSPFPYKRGLQMGITAVNKKPNTYRHKKKKRKKYSYIYTRTEIITS